MSKNPRILFCHCTYAQVVPKEVKAEVLRRLCESGHEFEAVADLCEMSARQDSSLKQLAEGTVKIAACYPRAVKWLFAAGQAPLAEGGAEVLNMREDGPEEICGRLEDSQLNPNVPKGAPSPADAPVPGVPDTIPSSP